MFVAPIITRLEAGALITAADVWLQFDETLLRASACTAGADVQEVAGFECRLNMPRLLNSVQLSYVTASGTTTNATDAQQPNASGSMETSTVELARVTFQVPQSLHSQCNCASMFRDSVRTVYATRNGTCCWYWVMRLSERLVFLHAAGDWGRQGIHHDIH